MCTLSKLYSRVGRDLSSRLVRAPWRSIVRRSTSLGAISITVSVSRKAWPERENLAEAMELQTTYWRKQLGELSSQAGEMRTLSTKVTADVAAPIRAQVTRGMKGLHKAT